MLIITANVLFLNLFARHLILSHQVAGKWALKKNLRQIFLTQRGIVTQNGVFTWTNAESLSIVS